MTFLGLIFKFYVYLLIFDLVVNRLTEGNGQNQALDNSSVEVKFLTLALCFSLLFF